MAEMVLCPRPHLCGARRHHSDKEALAECQRRGDAASLALEDAEQVMRVISTAGRTESFSPGESRYLNLYATADLLEADTIGPEGQDGVDAYAVTLEGESTDEEMSTTFWVASGETPPSARDVADGLIIDHDFMHAYGQNWQGWSQRFGLSTDEGGTGQREWDRVHREYEQLERVLGDDFEAVQRAIREEKRAERISLDPAQVSPAASAAMDRVLGAKDIQQVAAARPMDLLVDMMMSEESEPIEMHDVTAWQAARVAEWSLARRR